MQDWSFGAGANPTAIGWPGGVRTGTQCTSARTARHGRGHITLHLPEGWHREQEWMNLFEARHRPANAGGLTSPDPVTTPHGPNRPPAERRIA